MEVWVIRRHETGGYAYGMYATRVHAIKSLPALIKSTFLIEKRMMSMLWFSIQLHEVVNSGIYYNEMYKMYWTIESIDWTTKNEEEIEVRLPISWFTNELFLEDGKLYDIRLTDDTIVNNVVFDEGNGLFFSGEDEIIIEDVNEFKEVYLS